jgi:hypothetical protein
MSESVKTITEKRKKWVEANRENGFDVGLKRLLTDLYPDNAHFIYELLQNAEDAQANEVRFILHEDRTEFEHDGKRLFSHKDVEAITSIGFSTKRDDATRIGKFGVGFKAVFAYTETPQVESGEFCFKICDMVVPEPYGFSRSQSAAKQTRFILPFDSPKKTPEQARNEIERLLKALGATTLLFLTHIRKIEYFLPDSTMGYIERIGLGANRFEIRVQLPHELAPAPTWFLKFDKDVKVEEVEAGAESPKEKICRIAVVFGLNKVEAKRDAKANSGDAETSSEWELAQMNPGRVCIYFPADKETSNLRFHLHAPFASTVARDSVRDCAGNYLLRDHLADLLAESLSAIRDQGLLTVRALAVLPNDKDNLSEFYQPLMDRLVEEFKEKNLVPMRRGGHASARGIFRGSKALSELIDDDDMLTLLGEDYPPPIWAVNPSQRNQREVNFFSMLDIEEWTNDELVEVLSELDDEPLADWMKSKSEEWHQRLYALLEYQAEQLTEVKIIRCSDGIYRKGDECFFPTKEIENDGQFPRVAKGVYFASEEENKKVLTFLETVGVREVDELVEIEAILKSFYTFESKCPNHKDHCNHLRRFMRFLDQNQEQTVLFKEAYLFMVDGEDGVELMQSSEVYLDAPYMDTSLSLYFGAANVLHKKLPLSSVYKESVISAKRIGKFANMLGVLSELRIEKTTISYNHPEWHILSQIGGDRYTGYGTNKDYHIPGLIDFFNTPLVSKSKLVWWTMKEQCSKNYPPYLHAFYGRNASHTATAKSTLVHDLRKAKWVPQKTGDNLKFVQPRDAIAENLPEGLEYQTGWEWLKALEFGKGIEEQRAAQRLELERQSQEYENKEQAAKKLGFDSSEEAEEIARMKREKPEEFRKFKESAARKDHPTFPTRQVVNSERRKKRLGEQFTDAPRKKYETRKRIVRTTNGAIDQTTWLRNQYTNEDGQMICQISKEEMPFRKRDGEYYFEAVELFKGNDSLPKEHEAQYLALCPTYAAKYKEFIKNDDEAMKKLRKDILSADGCEIQISLGDEQTSIRFVETHIHDLKTIIESI